MKNTIYKHEKGNVYTMVKVALVEKGQYIYQNILNKELHAVFSNEVTKDNRANFIYFENDDHAELVAISWHEEQIRILKLHRSKKRI